MAARTQGGQRTDRPSQVLGLATGGDLVIMVQHQPSSDDRVPTRKYPGQHHSAKR